MSFKDLRQLLVLGSVAIGASATIPSCGGSTTGSDGTDGVTHWLDSCDDDDDCGSLECLCGVCTVRCTDRSECASLDPAATCTIAETCASSEQDAVCTLPPGAGGSDSGGSGGGPSGGNASGGTGGSGSGGSGGSPSGGAGGSSACAPLDARTGATDCARIEGYTFDGTTCHEVLCSCEGSDCDRIFATAGECRTTYGSCLRTAGDPCAPMDAAPNGDDCTTLVGYAWNGTRCDPIPCGCVGTTCDALYDTLGSCEQAHVSCHLGVSADCQRAMDCSLDFASCCGACGLNLPEDLVAISSHTWEDRRAAACDPGQACPDCLPSISPDAVALCLGGACGVADISSVNTCSTDGDCQLRYKDCCECDGPPIAGNVVALSDRAAYEEIACARTRDCVGGCDVTYPLDMVAACVEGRCTAVSTNAP